jgi:hypothetical protein
MLEWVGSRQGALHLSLLNEKDLAEITAPEHPGERLMVCHNPVLEEQRRRKDEELLQATEKSLAKIGQQASVVALRAAIRGQSKTGHPCRPGDAPDAQRESVVFRHEGAHRGGFQARSRDSLDSRAASAADKHTLPDLLHGQERTEWCDGVYEGQHEVRRLVLTNAL